MPPTYKSPSGLTWTTTTELIGLRLRLQPEQNSSLYPQYPIGLHAWLLDQVRQSDPDLSAHLHDSESEKPFTLSALQGLSMSSGRSLTLQSHQTYDWNITALSQPLITWMRRWLKHPPQSVNLRHTSLQIQEWAIVLPPITYQTLWKSDFPSLPICLSFTSPTSFRRKGHHLPLPLPINVFHSYLRRWNNFSGMEYDAENFLAWIDESVIIARHQLQSQKVLAGKQGSVTGFTGAVEYQLTKAAQQEPDYRRLFHALIQLAPYCGTGHKTTFGLGQTHFGWTEETTISPPPTVQDLLAQRIADLTEIFKAQKKRQGGNRATASAEIWATILARRELGDSLQSITADLEMPYETVKTYVKLAKRAMQLAEKEVSQTE